MLKKCYFFESLLVYRKVFIGRIRTFFCYKETDTDVGIHVFKSAHVVKPSHKCIECGHQLTLHQDLQYQTKRTKLYHSFRGQQVAGYCSCWTRAVEGDITTQSEFVYCTNASKILDFKKHALSLCAHSQRVSVPWCFVRAVGSTYVWTL